MSVAMYLGLKSLTLKSGYRVLLSWSIERKVLIKERCCHLLQQLGCHQMPQLLRFGFKQQHVNAALIEHKELIRAQDWLVLNVPEHELPAKFATESSKASVHVLVKGKQ